MKCVKLGIIALIPTLGALIISLAGCSQPTGSTTKTIEWQQDADGNVQFSTNDSKYYSYLFVDGISSEPQTPTATVTGTVTKKSGQDTVGYGIVFCYQNIDNFYGVFITSNGQFDVIEMKNGSESVLKTFTASSAIKTGFGKANTISVVDDGSENYAVSINGTSVGTISNSDISDSTGKAGFIIAIGDKDTEDFPATPEDVRFSMSSPAAYP